MTLALDWYRLRAENRHLVADLTPLLAAAVRRSDYDPKRAHEDLAKGIREQVARNQREDVAKDIRAPQPGPELRALVLRHDPQELALTVDTANFYDTVRWAKTAIGADLADAGFNVLKAPARRALARYEAWAQSLPELPAEVVDDIPKGTKDIVDSVRRARTELFPQGTKHPEPEPPRLADASLSIVYLARDLSKQLRAQLRMETRRPDGTVSNFWADTDGGVYAFDPNTFDETSFTADLAVRTGLLTHEVRAEADDAGLNDSDMVRIYRTSWTNMLRNFEMGVSAEIYFRRRILLDVDSRLPDLISRAHRMKVFWGHRAGELRGRATVGATPTDEAQLEDTRRLADDIDEVLAQLHTLGDGAMAEAERWRENGVAQSVVARIEFAETARSQLLFGSVPGAVETGR